MPITTFDLEGLNFGNVAVTFSLDKKSTTARVVEEGLQLLTTSLMGVDQRAVTVRGFVPVFESAEQAALYNDLIDNPGEVQDYKSEVMIPSAPELSTECRRLEGEKTTLMCLLEAMTEELAAERAKHAWKNVGRDGLPPDAELTRLLAKGRVKRKLREVPEDSYYQFIVEFEINDDEPFIHNGHMSGDVWHDSEGNEYRTAEVIAYRPLDETMPTEEELNAN
jgi:hypothetical protein